MSLIIEFEPSVMYHMMASCKHFDNGVQYYKRIQGKARTLKTILARFQESINARTKRPKLITVYIRLTQFKDKKESKTHYEALLEHTKVHGFVRRCGDGLLEVIIQAEKKGRIDNALGILFTGLKQVQDTVTDINFVFNSKYRYDTFRIENPTHPYSPRSGRLPNYLDTSSDTETSVRTSHKKNMKMKKLSRRVSKIEMKIERTERSLQRTEEALQRIEGERRALQEVLIFQSNAIQYSKRYEVILLIIVLVSLLILITVIDYNNVGFVSGIVIQVQGQISTFMILLLVALTVFLSIQLPTLFDFPFSSRM